MFNEYIIRVSILTIFLIAAAMIDFRTRRIPNALTFPLIIFGVLEAIFFSRDRLFLILISLAVLVLISLLPGIGMGDIKLLMGMAAWTSPVNVLLSLAFASILVVIAKRAKPSMLNLLIMSNTPPNKDKTNSVPFAPYLLGAYIIIEGVTAICVLC